MNEISERELGCMGCGKLMVLSSMTNPDPGAPELLQPPAAAWLGLYRNASGAVSILGACTERCADAFLTRGARQ